MRGLRVLALTTVLLMGPMIGHAHAGIPIPCTGEHLVTVKETPPNLTVPAGEGKTAHINLGYKFDGCFSGEWVGYSGEGSRYYKLNDLQLKALVLAAGLTDVPSPPSFMLTFSASWAAWLWIVILGFAGLGMLKTNRQQEALETVAAAHANGSTQAAAAALHARVSPHSVAPRGSFGKR